MKERILVGRANGHCRQSEKNNRTGPAKSLGDHRREKLITPRSRWRVRNAVARLRVAETIPRNIGNIRMKRPFPQDSFAAKSVSFQKSRGRFILDIADRPNTENTRLR